MINQFEETSEKTSKSEKTHLVESQPFTLVCEVLQRAGSVRMKGLGMVPATAKPVGLIIMIQSAEFACKSTESEVSA